MTRPAPTPASDGRAAVRIASRLIIYGIIVTTGGAAPASTVRSNIVIVMTTTIYTNATSAAAGRRRRRRGRRLGRFGTAGQEPQDRFLLLVRRGRRRRRGRLGGTAGHAVGQGPVAEADAAAAAAEPVLVAVAATAEIVHGRGRRRGGGRADAAGGRRWRMLVLVLVLDGHVADRLVGRGLDVRAGDLRLLAGRPYLQVSVRPPFPVRQGHVVRTPADAAGAAQAAVVVHRTAAAAAVEAAAGAAARGLEIAVARARTSVLRPTPRRRLLVVKLAHEITAAAAVGAVPY